MGSNTHRNNFGRIQALDRENIGHVFRTPTVKDNITAGRKHLGVKQAFGEIQNVIHNQPIRTPLKNVRQGIKPSPLIAKANKNDISVCKTKQRREKLDTKDHVCPEYSWSEMSVLTWPEFEEKVAKGAERERKLKEEKWKQLDDELLKAHKAGGDDLFFGSLKEEFKHNLDLDIIPFKVPDLPVDDFAGTDFLNW